MRAEQIRIAGFRNLRDIHLAPRSGINAFVGKNGQGKTNLLEALFILSKGRSFRPYSKRHDWFSQKNLSSPVDVRVDFKMDDGSPIEAVLHGENGRWAAKLAGKRSHASRSRHLLPLVAFSPDDHALIRGEPERRRTFLDEMFADVCPGYLESWERYEGALRSRNKLLRSLKHPVSNVDKLEVSAWDEVLARHGLELTQLRRDLWPIFEKHFQGVAEQLHLQGREISVIYEANLPESALSVEGFLKLLEDSWRADLETGWTHRGPHRDDFRMTVQGLEGKTYASQGESRLLALALRWTHAAWLKADRGETPIFLLDDFSSEIDATHRKLFLAFLRGAKAQIFLTGTDLSFVDSEAFSDYTIFFVSEGSVRMETSDLPGVFKND